MEIERLEELHFQMNRVIEHYLIYRAINKTIYKNVGALEMSEFLVVTLDAHLEMFFVIWCKIFGSDKNNRLHYSRFIELNSFSRQLSEIDSEIDFDKYVLQMKRFRNKYVAHSDDYNEPVPHLESALKAIFVLDKMIKTLIDSIIDSIKNDKDIEELEYLKDSFGALEDYYSASKQKYMSVLDKISSTYLD